MENFGDVHAFVVVVIIIIIIIIIMTLLTCQDCLSQYM